MVDHAEAQTAPRIFEYLTVEQAERLLAAGKVRKALKKLDEAAWNIHANTPGHVALFERIRNTGAVAIEADGGRHSQKARDVIELANRREADVDKVIAAQASQGASADSAAARHAELASMTSGAGLAFNKQAVVAATSESLMQALIAAASVAQGCRVTSLGPGSIVVVRRYRPTWTIVIAIIGALFALLGLLALLYQAEETLTITLSGVEGGTRVVVSGTTSGELMHRVNTVLSSIDEVEAPATTVTGAEASTDQADTAAGTKRCPDCAEVIRAEARKCRFCGYQFAEPSS